MSDKVLERKTFQEGDLLFKEGDEPTHALIIQTGEVQILLNAEKDDEVTLATIGPGGIIGEMALLDSSNRMATARAKSGGAAIIVTKQVFIGCKCYFSGFYSIVNFRISCTSFFSIIFCTVPCLK